VTKYAVTDKNQLKQESKRVLNMATKANKASKNTLTILLIMGTLATSYFAYVSEGSYFFETILGSLLYGAPAAFFALLVAIRVTWTTVTTGLLKCLFLIGIPFLLYGYVSMSVPESDIEKEGVRVASYNVMHYGTGQIAERVETLMKLDADILSLLEVNDVWLNVFSQYENIYPHKYELQNNRATGVTGLTVIYSKFPILESEEYGDGFVVSHAIQVAQDTVFRITQVHPVPPLWRFYTKNRNETIASLSDIDITDGNTFILGDFNTVHWQNPLKSVQKSLNLRLLSKGTPTWPAYFPIAPIDHIYASGDVKVAKQGKICMRGSDHCLVYADIYNYIKNTDEGDSEVEEQE
jgi:endonuclease/exonuclease/phosphatase (EEP) superfamily protein YafD